ncbi:hypothetical protein [Streptomyces sp. IGB124]|uniref:hypothetical protein n=1 Tax=Streptomyces sp. IGB124 TaxID=1519485 RepID=UPI000B09B00B|nr:hypothetical protein [Streptomyces sp. IGB124]
MLDAVEVHEAALRVAGGGAGRVRAAGVGGALDEPGAAGHPVEDGAPVDNRRAVLAGPAPRHSPAVQKADTWAAAPAWGGGLSTSDWRVLAGVWQ